MTNRKIMLPPPPKREELREAPEAPRMIIEIARMLRFRVLEGEEGVLAQNTARLVMAHLAARDGVNQLELVRLTRLKASTVSVLLKRMEAQGYISRVPSETDRRAVRVWLTERGKAFDRERLSRISNNDQLAMRGISAEEEAVLNDLLRRIRDNLEEGGGK